MAGKTYRLTFAMSDGSEQSVLFTVPGGDLDDIPYVGVNLLEDSELGDVTRSLFDGSTATIGGSSVLDGSPV